MNNIYAFLLAILFSVPAGAIEWHPLGARALGMGGAGVAASKGPLAAYWNPAAIGRATQNAYGLQVPIGVHAAVTGSVIEGAKDLQALKDSATPPTQAEIDAALAKLNEPGNGARLGMDVGSDFKVQKVVVFANSFLDMGAVPTIDPNATPVTIDNGTNNSKLSLKGSQVMELGVGYGQELPFAPGVFLGGSLKLLNARVGHYDYFVLRNTNENSNMLSKFKDGASRSSNFGVDLGALWDVNRTFSGAPLQPRIGLVGRNLNNPKFKQPAAAIAAGVTGRYAVNPQVRMGASLSPFDWWTIATDLDLTRNLTPVDNVASRQFGVGNEFNVFNQSWINIPLRVGLMRNLAEKGSGTMLSAGAGLHFMHVFLDVSAAISPKRVTTQSQGEEMKIPKEAYIAFQLSVLFGGSSQPQAAPKPEALPPAQTAPQPAEQTGAQPASTEKVGSEAEKAHQELDEESKKTP